MEANNLNEIGRRIKEARQTKNLTMTELGEQLTPRVTKGTISNWENGRNKPNSYRLKELSSLLGVSIEYLETGNNKPSDKQTNVGNSLDDVMLNELKEYLLQPTEAFIKDYENTSIKQIEYVNSAIRFARPDLSDAQYEFMEIAKAVAESGISDEVLTQLTNSLELILKKQ